MKPIHSLLARQLKRYFGGLEDLPVNLTGFLNLVNEAYWGFDDDRKMLERSLELSSQELLQANSDMRAVFQSFPDLFFRLRSDGTILDSKTGLGIQPYLAPERILGKRIQDVPIKDVGRRFDAALRQVRGSRATVRLEYALPTPSGQAFYEARLVPLLDDQVITIIRDMTERRVAEDELARAHGQLEQRIRERTEELTQANASLRQSEERARTILATVQAGILIVDPETHQIADVNPVALRMIGASRDQLVGQLCHERVCPAEKGKCPISDLGQRVDNSERKLVRADGTQVAILKSVVFVDIDGRPMLLECFVDISERMLIQREMERAKEAAETANRAKSAFLASMSHELRTPLSAIIGFAELIGEKAMGDLTAKQEEGVRLIAESGRHLLALINEILDLAKVEAGKATLEYSPVDITGLLEQSLPLFKETSLKHGIRLSLDVKAEARGIIVPVDARKIKQVVYNLLSNAVKFTPDGGRIDIEAALLPALDDKNEGGAGLPALQVSIRDTGIGLAPEQREKVFEAFYQVRGDTTSKTPGAGLGLALVRQMVELHGGRVWVESEGGDKGSTFRFTIPLQPGSSQASSVGSPAAPSHQGEAQKPTQKWIADLIAEYRETTGSFSIGRLWPASAGVLVNQDSVLKELEAAKRTGDILLTDAEGNFILLFRADQASARAACRRIAARLESRMGLPWFYTVASYPEDGRTAQELLDVTQRLEESPT
jgi:PAS domain S-box-containing protein